MGIENKSLGDLLRLAENAPTVNIRTRSDRGSTPNAATDYTSVFPDAYSASPSPVGKGLPQHSDPEIAEYVREIARLRNLVNALGGKVLKSDFMSKFPQQKGWWKERITAAVDSLGRAHMILAGDPTWKLD